jgi:hypothetical protein
MGVRNKDREIFWGEVFLVEWEFLDGVVGSLGAQF